MGICCRRAEGVFEIGFSQADAINPLADKILIFEYYCWTTG